MQRNDKRQTTNLRTTPQDPSFQTVLTWRHQRLCIFGLYGTIQMLLLLLLLKNDTIIHIASRLRTWNTKAIKTWD